MNVPQKVMVNTAVQLAGRTITIALTLVSFAIVTRYLGVEGFGAYSLVLTFLLLAVTIADLGMTPIGVRELARRPEETHRLLANLLGLRVVAAGVAALVLVGLSGVVQYEPRVQEGLRLVALAAIALVLVGVPTIVFQSRLRLELAMVVEVVTSATTLILVIVVTTADLGFSAVLLATGRLVFRSRDRLRPRVPAHARAVRFRRSRGAPSNEGVPRRVLHDPRIVHFRIDTCCCRSSSRSPMSASTPSRTGSSSRCSTSRASSSRRSFPIIASYHATSDALLKLAIDKSHSSSSSGSR